MKRLFLFAALLIAGGYFTSCQKESVESTENSNNSIQSLDLNFDIVDFTIAEKFKLLAASNEARLVRLGIDASRECVPTAIVPDNYATIQDAVSKGQLLSLYTYLISNEISRRVEGNRFYSHCRLPRNPFFCSFRGRQFFKSGNCWISAFELFCSTLVVVERPGEATEGPPAGGQGSFPVTEPQRKKT